MMQTKGVRTTAPDYDRLLPLWEKCEDAAEGEHAIHAAGVKYLPKLADEPEADYKARMSRTPFFNATWKTISGLKGMMFRKSPTVEVPPGIADYMNDVDMAGTPLDMFAQGIAEALLTTGRIGVLVDHPPSPEGQAVTVAQASRLGLRPMLQKYPAKSIINWKTARINGVVQTVLLVLKESAAKADQDEFGHVAVNQYRVLDLTEAGYRQRVFQVQDDKDVQIGDDIYPQMNGKNMASIPFVFFGVDSIETAPQSPPLLDLVTMNLHHYQVSADWEHGCHFSGLPTMFISGYTAPAEGSTTLRIGGSAINALPDPNAEAYYVQVEGSFEALKNNLESKKAEMAVLGARMLESQKSAVESAETLAQRSAGEQSQLAAMAQVESMGMTKCLRLFADWAGQSGEVSYQISTDYGVAGMSPQMITALVGAWQAGMPGFSDENVYALAQRHEVSDAGVTFEEEQGRIQARGPSLIAPMPGEMGETVDTQAPQIDIKAIVDAIARIPAPVVNVAAPIVNIPAMVVNIPEQPAPQITVNTPDITVHPASVTVNNMEGGKAIELQYDADGNVTGGTVNPTGA